MNRFKKIIKIIGILILLIILFRGFVFRALVNYSKINTRNTITLTDKNLIAEIDKYIDGKTLNLEEIIELSNDITSKKLSFTFNKASSNPNAISKLKKANCIGYSALFNAIGNYILTKQNTKNSYEFNHLVGKLDIFGLDIHSVLNSPFFKDHDFNEIKNKQTGEQIYVDPSLSDYFRIDRITSK